MNSKSRAAKKRKLIDRYGSCCWWSGKRLPSEQLTIDHLEPKSLGGSDSLENLRLACPQCNKERGDSPFPPKEMRCRMR